MMPVLGGFIAYPKDGDRSIISNIIQEVKKRPIIWDPSNQEYTDSVRRKDVWNEIVSVFVPETATSEEREAMNVVLQKKWKNIRDRYSRELRMRNLNKNKRKTYVYFKDMEFLKAIVYNQNKKANQIQNRHLYEDEEDLNLLVDSNTSWEEQDLENQEIKSDPLDMDNINVNSVDLKEEENDDNRHFLLSLLPIMKNIPLKNKLVSRMEVMEVLNKYVEFPAEDIEIKEECIN